MNVFVLCTGRTGSVSFIKACQHIENFTADHESRSHFNGKERFDFPDQHIEADNRLSWDLGRLDKHFGKDAFYVHLTRDHNKVAESYAKRVYYPNNIVKAYCDGIKKNPTEKLSKEEIYKYSLDMVMNIESSIEFFLKDKPNQIKIDIDAIHTEFPEFWTDIKAKGNMKLAVKTLNKRHNISRKKSFFWYRLKINTLRAFKSIS
ncbi:MAG: hypothetical protein ACTH3E_02840 [Psychroflexus halocasei]